MTPLDGDAAHAEVAKTTADKVRRAQRFLLMGAVGLLPAAYGPGVFADPVNIPKLSLLLGALALAASLRVALTILGVPFSAPRRFVVPALLFAAAVVTAWAASPYPSFGAFGIYTRYNGAIPYLAIIAFSLLLADAFRGRPIALTNALVASGVVVALFGLTQMFFHGATIGAESETGWITSTLGHSNFVGGYLALTLPAAVGLWVAREHAPWGLLATATIGAALLFTFSQGAWVAAGSAALWFTGRVARTQRAWMRWLSPIGMTLGVALTAGTVLVTMLLPHPGAQLPGFLATATSRGFLWRTALATGSDSPLLGWGPGAFAIQGPLHRTVEDALLNGLTRAEDPHSLPLAVWSNLGILGAVALTLVFLTALWPAGNGDLQTQALKTVVLAYLVQSLVSVDVVVLRFGIWVALATLAVAQMPPSISPPQGVAVPSRARRVSAGLTCLAGSIAAVAVTAYLALPDISVQRGERALEAGRIAAGRELFGTALEVRSEPEYRRRLALLLANRALEEGKSGAPLIGEVNRLLEEVQDVPDVQALALHGSILNDWSVYESSANSLAIALLQRASVLDPHDPTLAVILADALVQEGRPEEAEKVLLPIERLLSIEYPEFRSKHPDLWATLAIAQARQGKEEQASETLRSAPKAPTSCRTLIAAEMLKPTQPDTQRIRLACPASLARLIVPREELGVD